MTHKCGCSEEMARVSFFNSAIIPPAEAPLGLWPVFPDQLIGCMGSGGEGVGIEEGGGDQGGVGMVDYQ